MNWKELTEKISKAAQIVFQDFQQSHLDEDLYVFALYTEVCTCEPRKRLIRFSNVAIGLFGSWTQALSAADGAQRRNRITRAVDLQR